MARLFNHFFTINSLFSFFIFIFIIILIKFKQKINKKKLIILCFVPTILSIIHFLLYNFHDSINQTFNFFGIIYITSIIICLFPFICKKHKIFSIIIIMLSFVSFIYFFYNTILIENIHNLSYQSYTKSFKNTIEILKKEYVLNEHRKIDYDKLYKKYYPYILEAENTNNEQLYLKKMFEFTKEFKDGHFKLGYSFKNQKELYKKIEFLNDYGNKDYGFITILLSDGKYMAIEVDEDSEAYNKGLRNGFIITKKDDNELNSIIDDVIYPNDSGPVLETERLIKSLYLFATGNDKINITFLDENDIEKTIEISKISDENTRMLDLEYKLFYWNYNQENLNTKMLNKNTGYIYIENEMFSPILGAFGYITDSGSYLVKVIDKKLKDLENKGMKNLVIDIRANSGGYLTESEAIASMFNNDYYMVAKFKKYNSPFYDKSYLKGNGKYSHLNITVLVNGYTMSGGDALAYLLGKIDGVKLMGFTTSNNSCQSVGGIIYLTDGVAFITYPIYGAYDENNNIFIDPNDNGNATIKLDEKIKLTKEVVFELIDSDIEYDYLLHYYLKNY